MKIVNLTLAFALTLSLSSVGQKNTPIMPPVRNCGTAIPDPSWDAWFNQQVQDYIQRNYSDRTQSSVQVVNYTIPMVVHVLHKTSEAVGSGMNISQTQVNSQLTVLNKDYSATGANIGSCPSTFTASIANTGIQFCLAKIDKNGNTMAEPGIDRIDWQAKGWTDPASFTSSASVQSYFDGTIKPASIWDPNKYLNIWVADMSGSGLLGYATFPAGTSLTGLSGVETASTSGVVILTTAFGNTGNVAAPYNLGRTVTHEVGHWLGLRHIWGDGTCLTDYCNDTPPAQQANFGCPTFPHNSGVCSGNTTGEMTMDFMDYTDDACMYMFTNDQTTRIQTAMQTGTYRTQVAVSTVCNSTNTLDAGIQSIINPANGSSSCVNSVTPKVVIMNYGSTTLTSCHINYSLDGAAPTTYSWTGSLASSASATVTLPALSGLSIATHTYVTTTSSPNGGTDLNTSNDSKTSVFTIISSTGQALPFTEGFEGITFVPTGWNYTPVNTTNKWSRVTTTSGFGTSTACAKMDNFSGTTTIAGQKDDMISPAISFSNATSTIKLKFDVAYAQYNTTVDSLNVFITTNCGTTWTKIYQKGGAGLATAPATSSAFTPTSTQWRKDSVSLSAYAGMASVKFKFESVSGWGNNLYLDNINLNFTPAGSVPVAAFNVSPSPACVGQTISLTDQSSNTPTSWSWTMTGGTLSTSTAQNPTVTYSVAGTYSITLTATNGTGSSAPLTKTVTVNPLPTVTASSASVCAGSSTILTASGASTYSWNTGATTSTISVIPTTTTIYTVTGTSAAGCSKSITTTVTVNPLPTVTASSATICAGNSATLTASGASTYSWSTGANTSTITVTPTVTTMYTVTGVSTAGCSKSATATVTITGSPTVIVNAATLCAGQTATLTASGASTYTWNTGATTASIIVTPTVNTTYTVTGANGNCTNSTNANVTVNSLPTVTASSATICAGNSTTLTASGASTYSWNTGATTSTISVTPTTTTIYTVTGTSAAGCSKSVTTTVTVNPLPTVTASSATVCVGNSATLTASGASTYSWSTGANTSTITVTPTVTTTYTVTGVSLAGCSKSTTATVLITGSPTVAVTSATVCAGQTATLTASGASTYSWNTGATTASITVTPTSNTTYTVTGANGNCTNSTTANVTVNSLPVVTASSATICAGNSTTLTASGASTYSWNTGATASTISVTPTTTTIYSVTGTNSTGCSKTVSATVTVNPLPVITVSSSTVCVGSTVTLTANGASTYTWSTGANTSTISVSPTVTTTYTVNGASTAGCSASATATVTITGSPTVIVNSATVCAGQTAALTASGASTYTWNTGATTASITVTPTVNTTYTVTGANGNCTNSTIANVTINSLPVVTASSSTVCAGNSTTLTASGASTYSWNTGATTSTISVTPTATTIYTVTGTNSTGCSKSVTTTVTVNPLPSLAVTSPSTCGGQTVTITASGGNTYTWSTGANTSTISVSPIVTTIYTVTGTSSAGCFGSVTSTVTVNSSLNVTSTSATVCAGQQATIAASGASNYVWDTGHHGATLSVTPSTTTVYTVTGSGGGCSATSTSTVTVNSLPVITANSATVCAGQQATINATGATSYTWNTGVTSNSLSVTPSSTTNYTVTGTDMNGCNNSATSTVVVNANPVTPTVTVGGSVLTSSSATGNQWYLNGVVITGATGQTYTATQNGNYYVEVTNSSGCSASSAILTINSVGIGMNPDLQFSLFPNPTAGLITLALNNTETHVTVEVINSIGQKVYEEQVFVCGAGCKKTFDLSNLQQGIYLIRINMGGTYVSKQVLLYK